MEEILSLVSECFIGGGEKGMSPTASVSTSANSIHSSLFGGDMAPSLARQIKLRMYGESCFVYTAATSRGS
jgi:hypothetical protein